MDFEGVKQGTEDGSIVLLDVRNRNELLEVGKIPTSINVPRKCHPLGVDPVTQLISKCPLSLVICSVPELDEALQLEDAAFESKYGFAKPSLDAPLVTHCLKGARAAQARDKLVAQGYQNVRVYSGSFGDWTAQQGPVEKIEN
jgi:rhodanese-related sulfurtransferase